jgi:predicted nucleotidyltransferase
VSIYLYFGLIYLLYGYRLVGMAVAAPTLAPLFRSSQQMRLLAEIFYGQPAPGAELARRTGIPQQTVARELARLEHAGLITTDRVGTAKVAAPAPDLPYIDALRQLLGYAGGIIPALIAAYEANPAIAEVFIFGSWARRFHGDDGPPPNDIDVAVVSDTLTRFDLAETRLGLEADTGTTIDQFVLDSTNERLAELRDGSVTVFTRHP